MDKQDVFNYIIKTPDNTNPAILKEMLDEISGGGNPNYVETITGTLENPFNNLNAVSLGQDILAGNASATLSFSAENKEWSCCVEVEEVYVEGEYVSYIFRFADFGSTQSVSRGRFNAAYAWIEWENGEVTYGTEPFVMVESGTSATIYDVDLETPCTLTIIHHPLPEDNT